MNTVGQLAEEAGMDLDEVLISLWDAGFDQISSPDDLILRRDLTRARRAIRLPTRSDFGSIDYWRTRSGLSLAQFTELLRGAGVDLRPGSRRLPKGAVKQVKRLLTQVVVQVETSVPEVREASRGEPTVPPLSWTVIGHERQLRYLTPDEIEQVHFALVQDFRRHEDPIMPAGVRDRHLFHSAVSRPLTSLGDDLKYPTVEMAAGALLHSLVHNHPFFNGNKRTGLVSMLVFLDENNMVLTCDQDDLFKEVILLAQHRLAPREASERSDREAVALAEWISSRSRFIERGDRFLKFYQLREILNRRGCSFDFPGVGNRINITRGVPVRSRFGRRPMKRIRTQVFYRNEGGEVERSTIAKIRKDLWLDEEHGVDSAVFYGSQTPVDEFIATYRKTLDRLAKL